MELYTSLKTRLENALLTETTIKTISNLALDVRRSPEFGKNLLKKLYQQKPQLKKMKDPEIQQAANALIETIVDEGRAKWAQDWFYYGHDPATTSTQEMSQKLEREIWGLWILDMGFGMVEYDNTSFAGEVVSGGVYYMVDQRYPFRRVNRRKADRTGCRVSPNTAPASGAEQPQLWQSEQAKPKCLYREEGG